MKLNQILLTSLFAILIISLTSSNVYAHPHAGQILIDGHTHKQQTQLIPLNNVIGLEKSTIFFHAPNENHLPWAFVEGNVVNHVDGYPVIIQIFKDNEAIHFAQTDVENDGDYQYRFRVLNIDEGITNKIFQGDYTVKIFKVVYLNQNLV